jgi:hypothetical protein
MFRPHVVTWQLQGAKSNLGGEMNVTMRSRFGRPLATVSLTAAALLAGALGLCTSEIAHAGSYTEIKQFPVTGNIQTGLISTIPAGTFTPADAYRAPFYIGPASDKNFAQINASFGDSSITIDTSIANATDVYTLMNAYSPASGQTVGTIEFFGSGGATQTIDLVAGSNIRDFYHGEFANALTDPSVLNAFTCVDPTNCLGAAGASSVRNGSQGTYVIDEQKFHLDSAFAAQTLTKIVITNTYSPSTPLLLGVTVATGIATTTTLTASPTSAPQGTSVSLTALVKAAHGTATPAGTVTFTAGSVTLGTATLNGTGQATLTTTSLPAGSDSVVAEYSGNSTFDASTSAAVKVTIEAALVTLSPTTITFPATIVGTPDEEHVVTLKNSGTIGLTLSGVRLTGANSTSFLDVSGCGTTLAAGDSCSIYVAFDPKKTGTLTGSLTIGDNAANSPQTVALSGTGLAVPSLTLSPSSLAFPATPVGSASEGQAITLKNSATTPIGIDSVGLSGADPGDFVAVNGCGATLAPGASCSVFVAFAPSAAGSRKATLSVIDDASGSPQAVPLTGTGK